MGKKKSSFLQKHQGEKPDWKVLLETKDFVVYVDTLHGDRLAIESRASNASFRIVPGEGHRTNGDEIGVFCIHPFAGSEIAVVLDEVYGGIEVREKKIKKE